MFTSHSIDVEQYFTIKAAAAKLNVHYWQLLKLVNSGDVKSYTFGNKRRRVKLSDIVAFIENTCKGGKA